MMSRIFDLSPGPGRSDLPAALPPTRWHLAVRALAERDYDRALQAFTDIGSQADQALVRPYAARQHAGAGRHKEAHAVLELASGFFRKVGATAVLQEADGLADPGG